MRTIRYVHRALLCLLTTISFLSHAQSAVASTSTGSSGNAALMSTAGQFSVSPSGAANYRIPIQVPPGVAGMAPKLELVYSSQGGNGILGLGWGISGLSTISRCARTKAQDGVVGGSVNFDANDRFCLDGQRLVLVSGTYGAAGSEYRTEIESFSKITALGTAGSGPASFLVKTKSGLTIEFGNTTDSRIEAVKASGVTSAWTTGTARAWAQNKVSDVKGNYLTVAYSKDSGNGSYLPSRMDYTGNVSSTPVLSPGMSVVFVPGTASRLDAVTGYQAGASYLNPKRIAKIQTYVGAALVKDYRLDYAAQSTALDRSQLSSITECDATGSCLPATSVQWGAKGTDAFATYSTWLSGQYGTAQGWSNSSVYPRQMVDVNGDGLPDIVGFAGGGVYVALNTGSGFAAPSYWISQFGDGGGWSDLNTYPRYVSDVNGDGLPDIVGFSSTGVMVALNSGTSFAAATTWVNAFGTSAGGWSDNDKYPRQLVDVNGDGLPDVVGFASGGVYVSLNTRTGFSTPTPWLANQFGTNQGWTNSTLNPRQLVDVNGDGLPDIVGFAGTGVMVALNTGTGFETSSSLQANYSCSGGRTLIGNACGVPANPIMGCPSGMVSSEYDSGAIDCHYPGNNIYNYHPIVVGYSCTSGTLLGSSCTIPASYSCPTGYTASGSSCTLSAGGTTASASWNLAQFGISQGWTDSNLHPRHLVDVNGDGLPDIVGFGPNGLVVSLNTGRSFGGANTVLANFGTGAGGWTNNNVQPRQIADVNGDGLPDIVGFSPSGLLVSLNDGVTFKSAINWNAYFGTNAGGWSDNGTYPRVLADLDGDGLPDVVGFSSSSVQVALNSRNAKNAYVTRIQSGNGEVVSPEYATLASSSVYTRDGRVGSSAVPPREVTIPTNVSGNLVSSRAVYPLIDIQSPMYVVSSVSKSNGVGGVNVTNYSYGGLKAELGTGRGMLGFRWMKSKEEVTGIESYTEYSQDFPYTGMAIKNETRLTGAGNAGVLKRSTSTPSCKIPMSGAACVIQTRCDQSANSAACTAAANARYYPYLESTQEESWDLSGAAYPVLNTATEYGLDTEGRFYGDPTKVTTSVVGGGSKSSVNEYYSADTANWVLGRLRRATVTSTTP